VISGRKRGATGTGRNVIGGGKHVGGAVGGGKKSEIDDAAGAGQGDVGE